MKMKKILILISLLPLLSYGQTFTPAYVNGQNVVIMDLGTAFKVADSTIALKQLREYVGELEPHVASLQTKLNLCQDLDLASQNLIKSQEAVIEADKKVISLGLIEREGLKKENEGLQHQVANLRIGNICFKVVIAMAVVYEGIRLLNN